MPAGRAISPGLLAVSTPGARGPAAEGPASAAPHRPQLVPGRSDDPWEWRRGDTRHLWFYISLAGSCTAVVIAILTACALVHRHRHRDNGPGTVDGGKGDASGAGGSTRYQSGAAKAPAAVSRPLWRRVVLMVIGLSPLTMCVLIGGHFHNVLMAMVLIHNGCMLGLSITYYVARSLEEPNSTIATLDFYFGLAGEHSREAGTKACRGLVLGMVVFAAIIISFFVAHCHTAKWSLCVESFERPLEGAGFHGRSMVFKVMAGLYFTFMNPLYEELFWRVFLHRELSLECGLVAPDAAGSDADLADDFGSLAGCGSGGGSVWHSLLRGALACVPRPANVFSSSVAVRWGVPAMYASYHLWPISVIFRKLWWLYGIGGFCFLVLLGRGLLLLRESRDFGIPAALVLHTAIDAAFVIVCLCEY